MKVAAESTVEAAAGEEVLAVRRAFMGRVSRWSRDSPPASGPGSELRARRLDPRSLEVCDIEEGATRGGARCCSAEILEVDSAVFVPGNAQTMTGPHGEWKKAVDSVQ